VNNLAGRFVQGHKKGVFVQNIQGQLFTCQVLFFLFKQVNGQKLTPAASFCQVDTFVIQPHSFRGFQALRKLAGKTETSAQNIFELFAMVTLVQPMGKQRIFPHIYSSVLL
jgi:hypothetical protein